MHLLKIVSIVLALSATEAMASDYHFRVITQGLKLSGTTGAGPSTESNTSPVVKEPLYTFTSHTFTTCAATGPFGPTLAACQTAYQNTSWARTPELFTVVGGVQQWVVPETGEYELTVVGAYGMSAEYSGGKGEGTPGERRVVILSLTRGDTLQLLVGQMGGISDHKWTGGGGGGSFVVKGTTPLVISAGGKGAPNPVNPSYNQSGAGFSADGVSANYSIPAKSFLNGGTGGQRGSASSCQYSAKIAVGGFGGGGASDCNIGGGGGGWYGGVAGHAVGYSIVTPVEQGFPYNWMGVGSITITRR